jgi:hypothetical protein
MGKKLGVIILVVCAIVSASTFVGCIDKGTISTPDIPFGETEVGGEKTSPTLTPSATSPHTETPRVPLAVLIMEDARPGSTKLTLVHHGGDTIIDAFKGNPPYWNSIQIWINDAVFEGTLRLNRAAVSGGDFTCGDELELFLDQELTDAYISIIYTPTGDILQRTTVGSPSSAPVIPRPSGYTGESESQPEPTQRPKAPSTSLILTGYVDGANKITLIHHGGETIVDAFKGTPPYWNSLQVKINGALYTGTVKLNGATISAGDFKVGDELEFFLDQKVTSGDTIAVIHIPSADILQRIKAM